MMMITPRSYSQQRREISEDRAKLDELRSKCKIREETYKIEIEKLRSKLDRIRYKFEQQQKQRQNSQEMHRLKEENMLLKSQVHFQKQQLQQPFQQASSLVHTARDPSIYKPLERKVDPIVADHLLSSRQGSPNKTTTKKQLISTDMELVKLAQHKLMKENKSLKKRVDLMQGQMKEIFEILVDEKQQHQQPQQQQQSQSQPQFGRMPQTSRAAEQSHSSLSGRQDTSQLGAFTSRIEVTKLDFLKKIKDVLEKHQSHNDAFQQKTNEMKEAMAVSKLLETDSSEVSSSIYSSQQSLTSLQSFSAEKPPSADERKQTVLQQGAQVIAVPLDKANQNAFLKNKTKIVDEENHMQEVLHLQKNNPQTSYFPDSTNNQSKQAGPNIVLNQPSHSRQPSQPQEPQNGIEAQPQKANLQGQNDSSRKGSEFRSIKEQFQSVLNSQSYLGASNIYANYSSAAAPSAVNPLQSSRLYDHLNQFQVPKHFNSTATPSTSSQPNTLATTNITSFQTSNPIAVPNSTNIPVVAVSLEAKRNLIHIPTSLAETLKKEGSRTSRIYDNSNKYTSAVHQQTNERISDEYIKSIIQQYKTPKKGVVQVQHSVPQNQPFIATTTAFQAHHSATKKAVGIVPPVEIPQFIGTHQPGLLSARGTYERDYGNAFVAASSSAQISPNRLSKTPKLSVQPASGAVTQRDYSRPSSGLTQNYLVNAIQQSHQQQLQQLQPQANISSYSMTPAAAAQPSTTNVPREAVNTYNCYFSNNQTITSSPINKKIVTVQPNPNVNTSSIAASTAGLNREVLSLKHKRQQSCEASAAGNKYNLKLNLTSVVSPKQGNAYYSDRQQFSDRPTYTNRLAPPTQKQSNSISSSSNNKNSYEGISLNQSPLFSPSSQQSASLTNRYYKK